MCITEYDESRTLAEQREEGRAEGREEGFLNALSMFVKDGLITIADAANKANMTVAEFEAKTGLRA
ncbi:MAG: resolvase [Oscillospiraceae bacterium]|nr:resolvase [Oscillospiraceae bacterium]